MIEHIQASRSPRARSRARLLLLAVALIAGLAAAALRAPIAQAATITVTTTADELNADGDCSLREAIRAANSDIQVDQCTRGSGADTITLPAGAYVLTLAGTGEDAAQTGDLDITDDLTIVGAGKDVTVIDGNGIDRVFQIGATVSMSELTVTGGDSGTDTGGGIRVGGELTLIRSRVRNNTGKSGIVVFGGSTLTAIESRISDNTSSANGGGIFNYGTVNLVRSVVDGNSGLDGGGVFSQGTLTLVNSTVSGNSANFKGGGIANVGTASLYSVTVAENEAVSGGGVYIGSAGTLDARNTIVADNVDSSTGTPDADCAGTLISQDYNLVEDTSGCTIAGIPSHNITGIDPKLGSLQANGGPTITHALQSGSPAINAGHPSGCVDAAGAVLTTDQRGFVRADRCDIGAFERDSPGAPTPTNTPLPPTATRTPTATHTPTPTASPSPTRASADPSPMPTHTPTATGSPSPTSTGTPGPSPTPRPAPDGSPTPRATPTVSGRYWVYLPFVQ